MYLKANFQYISKPNTKHTMMVLESKKTHFWAISETDNRLDCNINQAQQLISNPQTSLSYTLLTLLVLFEDFSHTGTPNKRTKRDDLHYSKNRYIIIIYTIFITTAISVISPIS